MRIVTASRIDGPPPLRARSTHSVAASYTATTSVPSHLMPGIPYATALITKLAEWVCNGNGVE